MVIKSVYYDQSEILLSIMSLRSIDRFCADISYGNGSFYKNVPQPMLKFDISPQVKGVIAADSCALPLGDCSLGSVVFDPPFLTYVRDARDGNGSMVMSRRFGGYWDYNELQKHYTGTITEAARVLRKNGIMVFKTQDIIHNHKMHCTHVNVINWASNSFRLKDLFILPAKHRMPIPQQIGTKIKSQKHARVYHSYFLVLEKI